MSCPTGYILNKAGACEWNYMPGDNNLDGTPDTPENEGSSGGGFWGKVGNAVKDYGPAILIGAGGWWQNNQNKNQGTQPPVRPTEPAKATVPVWVWIAGAALLLVVLVLLIRGRQSR